MECPKCHSEVRETDRYCYHCHYQLIRNQSARNLWTTIWLIACYPIGVPLMWLLQAYTKKTRWIITIILAVMVLLGFAMIIGLTIDPFY